MKEIVTFKSEENFRDQAEEVVQKHTEIITRAIPTADVHHVGSTAVKGSLTKGDVDLQIRVDEATFDYARSFLDQTYARNEGSSQTSFFGAYEKEDEILPLGLQLTLKHSVVDNFWKVTRYFKENPAITENYNRLKLVHEGKDMDNYRDEKALFMRNLLESESYQELSRRYDLYEKVKIVKGEKFVTFEELHHLSELEMKEFVYVILNDPELLNTATLNVVISDQKDAYKDLIDAGFLLHDETVQVTHNLETQIERTTRYTFVSLHELTKEKYKKVWAEAMTDSFNAPSSLSIDDQLNSVERELGADYKDSCMIVYEGKKAIGVVMPHIEPGTKEEGRLFYFGLVPSERGKGKSKEIHRQCLRLLRDEFGATSYIGSTSVRNLPMMKTFHANGCEETQRNRVYTLRRI